LFGGGQLREREGGRPHGAFVEVRRLLEAERRVPRLELLRALEEADDLVVLGIGGHPVPSSRREGRRTGFDDGVEPLGHGAIWLRHGGNLREYFAFPVRLVCAPTAACGRFLLLEVLLHRGSFLVRESFGRLAGIVLLRGLLGGALGASFTLSHFSFLFVGCFGSAVRSLNVLHLFSGGWHALSLRRAWRLVVASFQLAEELAS